MTTSKQGRKPSPKRKPQAEADLPVLLTGQSTSLGTLADVFPPELTALAQTGRQIVSDIKEMSIQELDAIIQAGKQKGQVTAGTQQTIQKLIEKLPEILESETGRAPEERISLVKDLINVIDNVDHRDHHFRTQQAQLLLQQNGDATLKVLGVLALIGLGVVGGAVGASWWANRE